MDYKGLKVTKHLQDGFRIEWDGDRHYVIYIDPFKLTDGLPKADAIFVTHEHFDHCDVESISKVLQPQTAVFGNAAVRTVLEALSVQDFREVTPDGMVMPAFEGLEVSTLPAYNINKFRQKDEVFHPAESHGVGYLLTIKTNEDSVLIYHMGDTDFNPQAPRPGNIDILMVPVSGKFVMTEEEAVVACNALRPEVAIPMHYDAGVVGSLDDAEKLKTETNCRVEILTAE